MSIESAKAFYSRMTTDQAFRTQLEQAGTREERLQILQDSGYDFTSKEWEAAKAQFNSELSDAELTAVSGGLSILPGSPLDPLNPPFTPLPMYGKPIIDPRA